MSCSEARTVLWPSDMDPGLLSHLSVMITFESSYTTTY